VFDTVGGFSVSHRYTQDAHLWFRILAHFGIGRTPFVLGKLRQHPGQDSVVHRPAQQAEEENLYEEAFSRFDPARLFPELVDRLDSTRLGAHAHHWFADTMARYRHFYDLADRHYTESLRLWPSIRNRSRLKNLLGARHVYAPRRGFEAVQLRAIRLRNRLRGRVT
jgi:hypothetical protein